MKVKSLCCGSEKSHFVWLQRETPQPTCTRGSWAVHLWQSNTPPFTTGLVWDGNIASADIRIILISDMKVWSDPFSKKWVQQDVIKRQFGWNK